ncbi:hypothetical protein EB796_006224 [Bugula neritina]|uniref:Uncharacterized protein n=1 Tax=Bugula neritina TaxID=10212 RepID=A0A7J7KB89_BUGNE|nr:hypothetical protein EB796_006224 [Bugula neritina]
MSNSTTTTTTTTPTPVTTTTTTTTPTPATTTITTTTPTPVTTTTTTTTPTPATTTITTTTTSVTSITTTILSNMANLSKRETDIAESHELAEPLNPQNSASRRVDVSGGPEASESLLNSNNGQVSSPLPDTEDVGKESKAKSPDDGGETTAELRRHSSCSA